MPDSGRNELGSNGFVKFRIKPDSSVQPGMSIPNNASIYFDYNAPIVTNTCETHIKATILPLKLLSFKARLADKKQVSAEWVTSGEINTKAFNIERSINGKDFVKIGTVRAIGNQHSNPNYRFTDVDIESNFSGHLYYRLQVVDLNGAMTYSAIEKVKLSNSSSISVYPNPAYEVVLVEGNDIRSVQLADNAGRSIITKEANGASQIKLPVRGLQKGMYMVRITKGSGEVTTEKLVIQ
jgi:hypothetical protein